MLVVCMVHVSYALCVIVVYLYMMYIYVYSKLVYM